MSFETISVAQHTHLQTASYVLHTSEYTKAAFVINLDDSTFVWIQSTLL